MDDLVQFLRARLDEDAELARQAAESGRLPQWDNGADALLGAALATRRRLVQQGVDGALADAAQAHAARHDPARVLAEVEAKRRIVELHSDPRGGDPSCSSLDYPENAEDCETLRLLALPYAGHPDYRTEWRS